MADLLPLRWERMAANPFAFYRGTANLMAYDLSHQPDTGIHAVICGDAHLANFGLYASPERTLVFDLNDFDEASVGPWEWDVYRLVTSAVIAAQHNGHGDKHVTAIAIDTAAAYRDSLRRLMRLHALDRYYLRVDAPTLDSYVSPKHRGPLDDAIRKAYTRTTAQAAAKLMADDAEGRHRFVEQPPVMTHLPDSALPAVASLFEQYLDTLRPDVALLLSTYQITDIAFRAVGVGSVGTRCYVLALTGPGGGQVLLQIKEANASVIDQYYRSPAPAQRMLRTGSRQGERVVSCQQVLQAVSDPFLGHISHAGHDYYVRQFRDLKGAVDTAGLSPKQLTTYTTGCAMLLARAHSQSPQAPAISGYLGSADTADQAFAAWAIAYARQSGQDYAAFMARRNAG